jgi:lipopolysaccharide transport protein LptA
MINLRQISTVIIFICLCFFAIIYALSIRSVDISFDNSYDVETIEKTIFESVKYYSINQGKKSLYLDSAELEIINKDLMNFVYPEGSLYSENGVIDYKSDKGKFDLIQKNMDLSGNVKLKSETGFYESERLSYSQKKARVEAKNNVKSTMIDPQTRDKIQIDSSVMYLWPNEKRATFVGGVVGKILRDRAYEEGMDFSSKTMAIDLRKSLISLEGDVTLTRSNYLIQALKGQIFLENYNKKLKYYTLYDDIKVREKMTDKTGRVRERRAYAQKLEGHLSTRKIILSGAPRVEQGGDVIKGYQITLRENADIVEIDDSQSRIDLKRE